MCEQHAPGVRFIALSDTEIHGVETLPLNHPEHAGWWAKAELFRPDLEKLGRIFFMDLDTVIVGSLEPFMIDNPGRPIVTEDWYYGGPSQSLLIYEGGELSRIYEEFMKDPQYWMLEGDKMKQPNFGDQILVRQEWSGEFRYIQAVYPGLVGSFKATFHQRKPPAVVRIVGFHGHPRPHEVNQGWLEDYRKVVLGCEPAN